MKKVVIRTDASSLIGAGHVMRCLTIAFQLKKNGYSTTFIMSDIEGNLSKLVEDRGFDVIMINDSLDTSIVKCEFTAWNDGIQKIDSGQCTQILKKMDTVEILVVDHYCLDLRWENVVSAFVNKIIVIDDLANRLHDCDILLDQNYFKNAHERYQGLVNEKCKLLLGPENSLLDNKYWDAASKNRNFDNGISRILLFFGGADPDNVTMIALRGLISKVSNDVSIDVIIGASNRNAEDIFSYCSTYLNVNVFQSVDNMQQYIANADIAFGAGGISTWERCVSGLPTFTIAIAENQVQTSNDLDLANAIVYLGDTSTISEKDFSDAYIWANENPRELEKISMSAATIMGARSGDSELPLMKYL